MGKSHFGFLSGVDLLILQDAGNRCVLASAAVLLHRLSLLYNPQDSKDYAKVPIRLV